MDTQEAIRKVESNKTLLDEQWRAYTRARDNGHLDWVESAKRCDNYYVGEQWDKSVVAELDAANRPHHSINLVMSTVNAILGEYIAKRQQIAFKPMGGRATQESATALSKVFHQIQQNNKSQWVEQEVFADGIIQDRGYFDIRIDFSDNVQGEVREIAMDPADVLLDVGAKDYDPNTWSEVWVTRWWTPDEIEVMHGAEKAAQVRYLQPESSYGIDSVQFDTETFAADKSAGLYRASELEHDEESRRVRRVRVVERQYRKLKRCQYFIDAVNGDERECPQTWNQDRIETFAARFELLLRSKVERKVRWTITADGVILHDDWSPYKRFTIVPYFPYFRRGKPTGLVRQLISPQDMLNKTVSQELHVVNTTANSGWLIQTGSLTNMSTEQLQVVGAKTGLVIEYNRNFEKPEKIQANTVPTGLDRISGKAATYFREISGVTAAMLGLESAEVSGVALENKQMRGLVQMDIVFDNLAKTRQMRAEHMLELVQQYYTETRLIRVTERDSEGKEYVDETTINQPTVEGTILNDLTVGEYAVVVSSQPTREAYEETQFAKLISLREAGVLVPDWKILEVAGLSDTAELVKFAREMAGAAEPSEEEIERMLMMSELEMALMEAQVRELGGKAAERMANVELILAKAAREAGADQVALQTLGAELRAQMEQEAEESRRQQLEIIARINIAREKNLTSQRSAQWQALTQRLKTDSTERLGRLNVAAKMAGDAAKAAAARAKAVTQRQQPKSKSAKK